MTDLRDELRLIGCHANGDARCTCNIGQDALALIDTQAADIERLRSHLQSVALDYLALDGQASEALASATAAQAEAARLREVLMKIADMTSAATWAPATGERWLDRIDETARAALGRARKDGPRR